MPLPALRPKKLTRRLLEAHSVREFHRQAAAAGIVTSRRRFMTVVMDISNKCNLKCRMCYFSLDKYFEAPPAYLTPGQFDAVAGGVLPWARTLSLSCGSEPTTSPHFVEILEKARPYGVPTVDFFTNGVLFNEKSIDAVIRCGVTEAAFSVDAAEKKTYESIRRGASFDRLVANIERMNARKKELGRANPELRFNITLMLSNIAEMEELMILAHRLGITRLDFRYALVYEGLDMERESLKNHPELSNTHLERAVRKAGELGMRIVAFPGYFPESAAARKREAPPPAVTRIRRFLSQPFRDVLRRKALAGYFMISGSAPFPYCRLPFSYILVNSGGWVYPCPFCHGEKAYGHIDEHSSFEDVWFNDKFRELRRRIIESDPPEMCRRCPNFSGAIAADKIFDPRKI